MRLYFCLNICLHGHRCLGAIALESAVFERSTLAKLRIDCRYDLSRDSPTGSYFKGPGGWTTESWSRLEAAEKYRAVCLERETLIEPPVPGSMTTTLDIRNHC